MMEPLVDRLFLLPGSERSNNTLAVPSAARPSRLDSPSQLPVALKSELQESTQLHPSNWASAQIRGQQPPQNNSHVRPEATKGVPSAKSSPNKPGPGTIFPSDHGWVAQEHLDPFFHDLGDPRPVPSPQPKVSPRPLRDPRMQSIALPERLNKTPPMSFPAGTNSNHALQDYELQLQLLEQQNKKGLLLARQGQQGSGSQSESSPGQAPNLEETHAEDGSSVEGTSTQEEHPQTHYTISEDEVGVGQWKSLAAMKLKSETWRSPPPAPSTQPPGRESHGFLFPKMNAPHQQQERQQMIWPHQNAIMQQPFMRPRQSSTVPQQQRQAATTQQAAQQAAQQLEALRAATAYAERKATPTGTLQWSQLPPTNQMPASLNAASTYGVTGRAGSGFATTARASSPPPSDLDVVQSMLEYVQSLEAQLGISRADLDPCSVPAINIQVFYCLGNRINPETYLAEPEWEVHDDEVMLRGCFPVHDSDAYIEKRGNVVFAIYKHYRIEHQESEVEHAMRANEPLPNPEPAYQDVKLISSEMTEAMRAFVTQHPTFRTEFPELDDKALKRTIMSPYIWWYHYRKRHEIQDLPPRQAELMTTLTDWIEASFGPLYDRIDHQFRRGRVSNESMEYFVHPGQVFVLKDSGNGLPIGCLATTRPSRSIPMPAARESLDTEEQWSWDIVVRSYSYAGEFFQRNQIITLNLASDTWDDEVDVASLKAVPLQYAGDEIKEVLERRGKTFWKCRTKRLVSYEATPNSKQKKHHAVRGILVAHRDTNG